MLKIVLYEPQIPPNTGNIARTCAALKTELHLVGNLGFEISDRAVKRAGLDYWPYVDLHQHADWTAFKKIQTQRGGRLIAFSVKGKSSHTSYPFQNGDWLLFGQENKGLPPEIMANCDEILRIPMIHPQVRSLNLSVSVAVGLYEAKRQLGELTSIL
ncbi:tRNA (uridine(34)/cytosine(34)/5-carboxymethylaminomethyluridine(34)-2'-O)-methyltransferase TrmL [Dactylococcopsis salina]|uniref:Putative tRNA (cytidine(34)-2'-O)-methyltransferase n=1 Tax=Dactylococcopsis salina (strain PCC 8305) TaxID=13035 RepID=K9YRP2_DACS8|nr:tRNA (uridine(34)/cytosine(34)/5-carboxymethylaminomethyluridine(34)-2'-O)-methyltransferase TrmL [Dactylococcopsis salina]AFZ49621.1 rRNA methylase, putative, group 2 [Dactylococcopsis salina PCC 8305]